MIPAHCTFDLVIIDEAGQSTEPDSLIPLQHGCRRLVLIGDPLQLPPTAMDTAGPMRKSLFERLMTWAQESGRCCMLEEQYRMHPAICNFASKEFYQGRLRTAELRVTQAEPSYLSR
jgi:superfamily I DNA and/or RNA helicase